MFRMSATITSLAALAMIATPVAALDLPMASASPVKVRTGAPDDAAGWGRDRRHRRGGIDTGDVIAGVLVLGAIAAIAGSAKSRDRERYEDRYPRPDPRDDDARYRTQRDTGRYETRDYQQSSGIDRAVDMCVDQVERGDDRIDSVDNAARTSDGWHVSGALDQGENWSCWIDNDGRIREVDFGPQFSQETNDERYASVAATVPAGEQLSDQAYARARAATRTQGRADAPLDGYAGRAQGTPQGTSQDDLQPAYPGGPYPGEEGYEEAIGG